MSGKGKLLNGQRKFACGPPDLVVWRRAGSGEHREALVESRATYRWQRATFRGPHHEANGPRDALRGPPHASRGAIMAPRPSRTRFRRSPKGVGRADGDLDPSPERVPLAANDDPRGPS